MLSTSLLTNEVKDRLGVEQEFEHHDLSGRTHIYRRKGQAPSLPTYLKIAHQVTGVSTSTVRRSVVRVDKSVVGKSGKVVNVSCYKVWVVPEGELDDLEDVQDVSANIDSFCATTGAANVVLFDGSGNGDSAGINGDV